MTKVTISFTAHGLMGRPLIQTSGQTSGGGQHVFISKLLQNMMMMMMIEGKGKGKERYLVKSFILLLSLYVYIIIS